MFPARDSYFGQLLAISLGALAFLWIAILNGFPLLFSDSGTYIRIGTELHYPLDRSVTYGLAIAPLARVGGLWAVIVAQAVAAAWIIQLVVETVTRRRDWIEVLATLFVLAAVSSLPWYADQVMADIFTSLVTLVVFLIFFGTARVGSLQWYTLPLVLALLVSFHLSHLAIGACIVLLGILAATIFHARARILANSGRAIAGIALAIFCLSTLNWVADCHFKPSLTTNHFLVARLFDGHIGQPVLSQMCAQENLLMCEALPFVEDRGRPFPGQDYLWDKHSPVATIYSKNPIQIDQEEGRVVQLALLERTRDVMNLAFTGWGEQLLRADTADGMGSYSDNTQVAQQIEKHFPQEILDWKKSLQETGHLMNLAFSYVKWLAVLILVLSPLILLRAAKASDDRLFGFVTLVIGSVFINAAVCGALSGPADRYQSRVMWLLPLLGILTIIVFLRPHFKFPALQPLLKPRR